MPTDVDEMSECSASEYGSEAPHSDRDEGNKEAEGVEHDDESDGFKPQEPDDSTWTEAGWPPSWPIPKWRNSRIN